MRPPNQARPSRTSEETAIGSGNSRRSTPKSRSIALLPDPNGVSSIRSIATTSPGLAPRTTIGPAIGARGCPSHAGVKGVGTARMSSTSSNAPRTSTVNSSPESTVIVGGVWVLTKKRYSVRLALMCRSRCIANLEARIAAHHLAVRQSWACPRVGPVNEEVRRNELAHSLFPYRGHRALHCRRPDQLASLERARRRIEARRRACRERDGFWAKLFA